MSKGNNLQSLFCGILFCISVAALVIACLAFAKKDCGKGEHYKGTMSCGLQPNVPLCLSGLSSPGTSPLGLNEGGQCKPYTLKQIAGIAALCNDDCTDWQGRYSPFAPSWVKYIPNSVKSKL